MTRPQRDLPWHLNTSVWKGRLALLFSAYCPDLAHPTPVHEEPESPARLACGRKEVQVQGGSPKDCCPCHPASVPLCLGFFLVN